jgi:hypothetical protein
VKNCNRCEFNNNGWCNRYRKQRPEAIRICNDEEMKEIEYAISNCHDQQIRFWLQELIQYKVTNEF